MSNHKGVNMKKNLTIQVKFIAVILTGMCISTAIYASFEQILGFLEHPPTNVVSVTSILPQITILTTTPEGGYRLETIPGTNLEKNVPPQFEIMFTRQLSRTTAELSPHICVNMSSLDFWEAGDEYNDVLRVITGAAEVLIDGIQVETTVNSLGSIVPITNLQSTPIGSIVPGIVSTCVEITNMAAGLHTGEITITTTSGVEHSRSWTFEISE